MKILELQLNLIYPKNTTQRILAVYVAAVVQLEAYFKCLNVTTF